MLRCCVFFFNDTATTEIYTLSLHDALPIFRLEDLPEAPEAYETDFDTLLRRQRAFGYTNEDLRLLMAPMAEGGNEAERSEEHTSELQSPDHLVCRLLLEKKKTLTKNTLTTV